MDACDSQTQAVSPDLPDLSASLEFITLLSTFCVPRSGSGFMLSLFLNVLWIVFGGLWMAVGWLIAAVIMAITIIGLPWARAAVNIAGYTLLPFGQTAVSRADYSGREDLGTGPLGMLGNMVWFVFAGWWLALGHLLTAIPLAIT